MDQQSLPSVSAQIGEVPNQHEELSQSNSSHSENAIEPATRRLGGRDPELLPKFVTSF